MVHPAQKTKAPPLNIFHGPEGISTVLPGYTDWVFGIFGRWGGAGMY